MTGGQIHLADHASFYFFGSSCTTCTPTTSLGRTFVVHNTKKMVSRRQGQSRGPTELVENPSSWYFNKVKMKNKNKRICSLTPFYSAVFHFYSFGLRLVLQFFLILAKL